MPRIQRIAAVLIFLSPLVLDPLWAAAAAAAQEGSGEAAAAPGRESAERPRGPRDRSDFTHLREEGFPLNVDPEIIAPEDADLGDDDMVLGVVLGDEARAYPVNYMNGPTNEVVNDTLGGRAIASTW